MLRKRKRKRNPRLQGIAEEILKEVDDWEYLSEGIFGEIYYFIIDSPLKINNVELKSGEYVLKIEKYRLRDYQIEYLQKLSDLKLIPKIYYIDNQTQIMKYIEGKTLDEIMFDEEGLKYISEKNKTIIYSNLKKLIKKWHDLGYGHGDLNTTNIIFDKNLNVCLIDPRILDIKQNFKYDKQLFSEIMDILNPNSWSGL